MYSEQSNVICTRRRTGYRTGRKRVWRVLSVVYYPQSARQFQQKQNAWKENKTRNSMSPQHKQNAPGCPPPLLTLRNCQAPFFSATRSAPAAATTASRYRRPRARPYRRARIAESGQSAGLQPFNACYVAQQQRCVSGVVDGPKLYKAPPEPPFRAGHADRTAQPRVWRRKTSGGGVSVRG